MIKIDIFIKKKNNKKNFKTNIIKIKKKIDFIKINKAIIIKFNKKKNKKIINYNSLISLKILFWT